MISLLFIKDLRFINKFHILVSHELCIWWVDFATGKRLKQYDAISFDINFMENSQSSEISLFASGQLLKVPGYRHLNNLNKIIEFTLFS